MEVTCPVCEQPAQLISIDLGIGPYEYWGARGVHVHLCDVTACCEAHLEEENIA